MAFASNKSKSEDRQITLDRNIYFPFSSGRPPRTEKDAPDFKLGLLLLGLIVLVLVLHFHVATAIRTVILHLLVRLHVARVATATANRRRVIVHAFRFHFA